MSELKKLESEILQCTHCVEFLPQAPRPILQIGLKAKILIAGQAPGRRVNESGIPFDDASGDRLRAWMGVDKKTFYNREQIAILPMAFCFPGTGKSGDLPPRPECAQLWRERLLESLRSIELTICIGQYAHDYHLKASQKANLTETVKAWKSYGNGIFPIPHPSPRNNIWLKANPWFETEVVPALQKRVCDILQ